MKRTSNPKATDIDIQQPGGGPVLTLRFQTAQELTQFLACHRGDQTEALSTLKAVFEPTKADEVHVVARVLEFECGYKNLILDEHKDPRVVALFPLHRKDWNKKKWNQIKKRGRCSRWYSKLSNLARESDEENDDEESDDDDRKPVQVRGPYA